MSRFYEWETIIYCGLVSIWVLQVHLLGHENYDGRRLVFCKLLWTSNISARSGQQKLAFHLDCLNI